MMYFVSKRKLLRTAVDHVLETEEAYRTGVGKEKPGVTFREYCADFNALSHVLSNLGMNLSEAVKNRKNRNSLV